MSKQQLIAGFLGLGILLIGISLYYSMNTEKTWDSRSQRLARAERETGKVFVLRSGIVQKEAVPVQAPLYNLDSVETSDTGEVSLYFEGSYRIRVLTNAFVTLEQDSQDKLKRIVIFIKRGEIKIDGQGPTPHLLIAKNGQRILASEYQESELALTKTQDNKSEDPGAETSGLSEQEIAAGIGLHRASFFKCYAQLLQKDPTAKGEVALSFTIENNGKLSVSDVTSRQMVNEEFKSCLIEVLARVNFRPFPGPAISTLFPLKFE
jgi:hypothetical protein